MPRRLAISVLGNILADGDHYTDAVSVKEAELAMKRRVGATADSILVSQGNLALTYSMLGRHGEGNRMLRDVYCGRLKINGEEHESTINAALNYAASLVTLRRYEEAKALLRKAIPVARRVLGEGHDVTLKTMRIYAWALHEDPGATLDDLREAVTALEETERTARRVFGGTHPLVLDTERKLRDARAALRARETQPSSDSRDGELDEVEDVV